MPDLIPTIKEGAGGAPATPGFDAETILKAFAPKPQEEPGFKTPTKPLRPAFTLDNLPKAKAGAAPKPAETAAPKEPPPEEAALEAAVAKAKAEAKAAAVAEARADEAMVMEAFAKTLSDDLDAAMTSLSERICDSLAAALTPVLSEAMVQDAVRRFSDRLDKIVSPSAIAPPVRVKGPEPLIEALRKVRGPRVSGVKLETSEQTELTAELNETTLRTTVGTFAAMLKTSARLSDMGQSHDTK
ncbi:MAG: hypothetical protein AAF318_11840 [Pseudomonadota bacterium]